MRSTIATLIMASGRWGWVSWSRAGGGDQHGQGKAECVDTDVPFAACDLLARVDALAGGRDV
ncbi:hypothetical protein SUDANB6_00059 [Streptomyces sp. enrichment culture]